MEQKWAKTEKKVLRNQKEIEKVNPGMQGVGQRSGNRNSYPSTEGKIPRLTKYPDDQEQQMEQELFAMAVVHLATTVRVLRPEVD